MMATVPHVTSGLGLRKFQADGFLLTRMDQQRCVFQLTNWGMALAATKTHRHWFHSKNEQDRQCRYKRNTEERSRNRCCRRKSNKDYIVWKCVC